MRLRRDELPLKLKAKKSKLVEVEHGRAAERAQNDCPLAREIAAMETELKDNKRSGEIPPVITTKDLDQVLRTLGRNCSKRQLEYMIWEVDENLDGCIDWREFKMMYHQNVTDETGLEPFELFNIVQFLTYLPSLKVDRDFKPQITEDDTMSTLFARYGHDQKNGRVHVEGLMTKLFGDKLKAQNGEGVLSLDEYLGVVSARNYSRRRSSAI